MQSAGCTMSIAFRAAPLLLFAPVMFSCPRGGPMERTLRPTWTRVLLAVLLGVGIVGRISHGQSPSIVTRGVEEAGRVYIGEPVTPFIGHLAMLFVTGKDPLIAGGTMQDAVNWVNDPLHSVI